MPLPDVVEERIAGQFLQGNKVAVRGDKADAATSLWSGGGSGALNSPPVACQ